MMTLDHVDRFVDGAAVNRAGTLTYAALAAAGDMVSLTTGRGAVHGDARSVSEQGIVASSAGALSVAGLTGSRAQVHRGVPDFGRQQRRVRYGGGDGRSLIPPAPQALATVDFRRASCAASPDVSRRRAGPNDDITLFSASSSNGTGENWWSIELGSTRI